MFNLIQDSLVTAMNTSSSVVWDTPTSETIFLKSSISPFVDLIPYDF